MPKYWLPLVWRLALSLGLVLGPWLTVQAAPMAMAAAVAEAGGAPPPCHGDPGVSPDAERAAPMPCCDEAPCLGCAPVLCAPGQASALPAPIFLAPRLPAIALARTPDLRSPPAPPMGERLRPPIA